MKKGFDFSIYQAAIFDLDGTLVHSEHAWEAAKIEVLGHYGVIPSPALFRAHVGRGLNGFLDDAFAHALTPEERTEIGNEIGAVADVLLPQMREPIEGAAELLCKLHDAGLKIAICSSSPRRHIDGALEMLNVSRRISTIVSGAELPRGKPDPLPFQVTLKQLGVASAVTCVFEDSFAGVQSALGADLPVLAIGEGCTHGDFAQCAYQAESFEDILRSSHINANSGGLAI